jgi:tyrosyl-tRNA synthetase
LKIFTFIPLNEIQQLMEKHRVKINYFKEIFIYLLFKTKPHEYAAQIQLAKQITLLVHGG